jgi:hypothetical protein
MKNLTESLALRIAGKWVQNNTIIKLDGKLTLGTCSACDYLVNHCGYKYI